MTRPGPDPSSAYHDQVITADEVAALLRMTPAWVYAETRHNRIPHMRLGRYFRYRRSTIETWMEELEARDDVPRPIPIRERGPEAEPGNRTIAVARPLHRGRPAQ